MLRLQRGDREAFAQLVARYQQPVIAFIHRSLGDLTEAEDLAQNAFLQVYKSARRYRPSGRFSTWLFTIARNLCLNEQRRRARHPASSLDAPVETNQDQPWTPPPRSNAPGPAELTLRAELEAKVAEAVRDLPENQRTAILLCSVEGLAYEEIARILGVSVSATKSLIHRARLTLRARLKPYLQSGTWEDSHSAPQL